jgi:4'-phosphopantetheinyl transferase
VNNEPRQPKAELTIEVRECPGIHGIAVPFLDQNVVQVWRASMNAFQPDLPYLQEVLSAEEHSRAERFRFEKDSNQFTTARGLLRILLAGYLSTDARQIQFQYSAKGKPGLCPAEAVDIDFNVAHSGNLMLLAFGRGRRIGVDVEMVRRDLSVNDIAQRFFSAAERNSLNMLAAGERHEAFFRCWTRKEAYIKATGDGLSLLLDQFDVSLMPEQPALLATRPDPAEASRWAMHNIDVDPGYAGSLVVERVSRTSLL